MALDWLIRDNEIKDHQIFNDEHFGTEPPCTGYEKKPLVNPETGETVEGLYSAWITLNNPAQMNSYTTKMIKGVLAGMHKASMERDVMAIIFTATGDRAFCTGGNTKEYAEYYSRRPMEYTQYMDLFSGMIDGILKARKPVICRCNGMRIAGGQEIGQACDFTVAADTASFGQAGTRHGSTPTGGSTDFLPWNLSMEQAMWQATANEMWSAAKMERMGLISKYGTLDGSSQFSYDGCDIDDDDLSDGPLDRDTDGDGTPDIDNDGKADVGEGVGILGGSARRR